MNIKNLSRDDIAKTIHDKFGFSKKDCLDLVNDTIEIIIDGLIKSKFVKIHNFGTFKLKRKNSRIGRNPKTKETVIINERNVVTFKPSKNILKYLNNTLSE